MVERNSCTEVKCSSSCCHDVWFYMIDNPNQYFQNVKIMPEKLNEKPLQVGVYFSVSGGQYKVIIIGDCPNLYKNECNIYSNRPPGCKKTNINSTSCREARERDSIKTCNDHTSHK